jgi:hypothetical protein
MINLFLDSFFRLPSFHFTSILLFLRFSTFKLPRFLTLSVDLLLYITKIWIRNHSIHHLTRAPSQTASHHELEVWKPDSYTNGNDVNMEASDSNSGRNVDD